MAGKKPLPTQPSFIGKHVYLRPMTPEDALNHHFWSVQSEPQSMSAHPLPFFSGAEIAEKEKKRERTIFNQRFAIVATEDNTPVGIISFFDYNPLNRSAELGVLIDPDERKKGFAQEAMRLLIRFLFRSRGLNKVHAQTASFNMPAIKLLESLGFKRDGVLRQHHYYNDEFHDKLIYSLLKHEMGW